MTPAAPPTVTAVLDEAVRRLSDAGIPDPRRDAASLMALALKTDRGGVAARKPDPIAPDAAARFAALVAARAQRSPLQHLEGRVEFRGLELAVTPDVLIPRPETEDLVQAILDAGLPATARVADLGTGSGCIAIALALARPGWTIEAVDASPAALSVARGNAARLDARLRFVEADFGAPDRSWAGAFDAVVSNPPYVSEAEWRDLEPEVRDHEPKSALVPGPTGNEAYATLVPAASSMIAPGGFLALELGFKSAEVVAALARSAGFRDVVIRDDFQGIPRVLTARK